MSERALEMQELLSAEQVAEQLGLQVRTVRGYVRDGKLKAVRIGKQYRIAREDLAELIGRPEPVRRRRHVEASCVVSIDAIDPGAASRVATTLVAATNGPPEGGSPLRVETMYETELGRLRVIVLGDLARSADVLRLVHTLTERPE
jgi:excisionase family DNA binding protein